MTQTRLSRGGNGHSPPPLLDLRLLVLLIATGLVVWIALINPPVATAVALGLSVLYLLHRIIGR